MKAFLFIIITLLPASFLFSQSILKPGDLFPAYTIEHIQNAPVQALSINQAPPHYYLLNFWGTWCSPCLPEMDSLRVWQQVYRDQLQVVALADDDSSRVAGYLAQKPTGVWIASDTIFHLYQCFGFDFVGQCAVIGPDKKIVALLRTDSLNRRVLDQLLAGQPVTSTAATGNKIADTDTDPFKIDSTLQHAFTMTGYHPGITSMSRTYAKGPFYHRRISFVNVCASMMYRKAYDIQSPTQVVYEGDEKAICDFSNKNTLYCVDLLVSPQETDSLMARLRYLLNATLPVKARLGKKTMPVYVVRQKAGGITFSTSQSESSSYSFSGRGFDGTGVVLSSFIDYLSNELGRPVLDETGLDGRYDISTENAMRRQRDVEAALDKLGLTVEKAEREVETLILYF